MKSKNANKKRKAAQAESQRLSKIARPLSPPDKDEPFEPRSIQTVISEDELEITVETLISLAQYPSLIKSKPCKDLRTAVHEFRQACTTGVNAAGKLLHYTGPLANADHLPAGANLTARISASLADGQCTEARILLAEMRIRGEEPKLGALCRWVRDLDVISGLSTQPATSQQPIERSAAEKEHLYVLDAVLRATGLIDTNTNAVSNSSDAPSINVQEIWDLRPSTAPHRVYDSVLDKTISNPSLGNLSKSLRAIDTTEGPQRKPPNHHPAILYTSAANTIPLSPNAPPITFHQHPVVPGLGLATNVLSPDECKAIIAAGESVEFLPDAPIREDGDISILAHNFYWVVDTAFHDALWARISPYVPATVGGRVARGINRRFRVYRYVPGAEYRCHIDGAWPPSGILPDDTYVYDSSPAGKKQSSLFTFLVYLNDEFEGGETTYFLPAAREGTLNAYPVRPVMGGVAIFPHGDTRGALLHEGTGVRKGAKYIIRTDVEYDIDPS